MTLVVLDTNLNLRAAGSGDHCNADISRVKCVAVYGSNSYSNLP